MSKHISSTHLHKFTKYQFIELRTANIKTMDVELTKPCEQD